MYGCACSNHTSALKAEHFPWLVAEGQVKEIGSLRRTGHAAVFSRWKGLCGKECTQPLGAENSSWMTAS